MPTDLPSVALLITISMEVVLLAISTLRWTLMATFQYLTTWFVALNILSSLRAISFYCMTAWKRRFNLFFASSGRANNMAEFFAFMATGSNLFTTAHTFGCRNFRASHGVYMTTSWHLQGYLSPARLTLFDTLITQVLTGMFAWFFSFVTDLITVRFNNVASIISSFYSVQLLYISIKLL